MCDLAVVCCYDRSVTEVTLGRYRFEEAILESPSHPLPYISHFRFAGLFVPSPRWLFLGLHELRALTLSGAPTL